MLKKGDIIKLRLINGGEFSGVEVLESPIINDSGIGIYPYWHFIILHEWMDNQGAFSEKIELIVPMGNIFVMEKELPKNGKEETGNRGQMLQVREQVDGKDGNAYGN